MAPIRSSTSIRSGHSSRQVLVAGDALARDMLVSGIIDALLPSGILVEEAQSSMGSTRAHRRHVASHRSSPGHIRRPRNSWILFRSDCAVELNRRLEGTGKSYDSQKFNKVLGKHWNSLSKAQQEPYKALALEEAENHKRLYPDWKYQPNWEKTRRGRGKGKKDSEVETMTVAPEATVVPDRSPPFEPVFTITVPVLSVSVPDVYACASPPSHPGPAVPRYGCADGTPLSSIFKDDPWVNFRGAVDPNITLFSFHDSPSSHRLEQGPPDFGDLRVESPGLALPELNWNDWFNFPAECGLEVFEQ